MRKQQEAQKDNSAGVSAFDLVDAVSVIALEHLKLLVEFEDGTKGTVTLDPSCLTNVFVALKDESFFNQVFIEHGAVTWPNEIDLAPDTMHEQIKRHGSYTIKR